MGRKTRDDYVEANRECGRLVWMLAWERGMGNSVEAHVGHSIREVTRRAWTDSDGRGANVSGRRARKLWASMSWTSRRR